MTYKPLTDEDLTGRPFQDTPAHRERVKEQLRRANWLARTVQLAFRGSVGQDVVEHALTAYLGEEP